MAALNGAAVNAGMDADATDEVGLVAAGFNGSA